MYIERDLNASLGEYHCAHTDPRENITVRTYGPETGRATAAVLCLRDGVKHADLVRVLGLPQLVAQVLHRLELVRSAKVHVQVLLHIPVRESVCVSACVCVCVSRGTRCETGGLTAGVLSIHMQTYTPTHRPKLIVQLAFLRVNVVECGARHIRGCGSKIECIGVCVCVCCVCGRARARACVCVLGNCLFGLLQSK